MNELFRLAAKALLGVSHDDGYLAEAEAVVAAIEPILAETVETYEAALAQEVSKRESAERRVIVAREELASVRFVLADRYEEIVWFGAELERRVKAARADAWDEGHGTHRQSGRPCDHFNPYRGDR